MLRSTEQALLDAEEEIVAQAAEIKRLKSSNSFNASMFWGSITAQAVRENRQLEQEFLNQLN